MEKESTNIIKSISGEVQTIRPKAIAIENRFYNAYTEKQILNFKKGDMVNIKFKENTKNGKTFNNIQSIELMNAKVIREHDEVKISDTTVNTILMISKDIAVVNGRDNFEMVLQDVFNAYNKVMRGKI